MSGNSKKSWNQENPPSDTLGLLLEQMTTQFSPNHDSFHYQPGFVPAGTIPWSSHHQASYPQPHPNAIPLDPSLSAVALGTQAGLNSLQSYSMNQDSYQDMEGNRTPLLRSSSDLGIRLNHFPSHHTDFQDCQLEGIMDQQMEPFDTSVFFSENHSIPISNVPPYQQHSQSSRGNENQHIHYTSYMTEHETPPPKEQSSYFSTKLSNFTASLGTWLSPLDRARTNYNDNGTLQSEAVSGNMTSMHDMVDNIQSSSMETTPTLTLSTSTCLDTEAKQPMLTKPTYSDVLSKSPLQEAKPFSNTHGLSSKSVSFYSNSLSLKNRTDSYRSFNNKLNKNRVGPARSNSPNVNAAISNNNDLSFNSKHTSITKTDLSYSKFALDDLDLANCNSDNGNDSTTINHKGIALENVERNKKRSLNSIENCSPSHLVKKTNKNESRKLDESPSSSDVEKIHSEKTISCTSFTQQKQTPKRSSCINLNLSSSHPSITAAKNKNSFNCSNNLLHRKGLFNKDETQFQFDGSDVQSENKTTYNSAALSSGNSPPSGNVIGASFSKSTVPNSRSRNVSNKVERSKEFQTKRNNYKRRKEPLHYSHLDLLMTIWTIFLLWMRILIQAGQWLLSLVVDVVQMSYHLLIHLSLKFWDYLKLYYVQVRDFFRCYWVKLLNYISHRKENSKKGYGDRKGSLGLDSNLPLPATGEEAMKRLLACRGKDPYNILGVSRECTDDDIKRYYKRQAFLVHPDKNKQPGAEEAFKILAHAFEIIGEPERREQYDKKVVEEAHLEGATGELASLLNLLKEKLEEAANTIRCTNCNKRHRRVKLDRPVYAARYCSECQIRHAAREGDIWAESWYVRFWWKHYACMEGFIYDISEWAACQRENLKHLQANTHSVQYRIVSGKKNTGGKNMAPECPTDPELEDFFNNLCRERFGQDFTSGTTPPGSHHTSSSEVKKRRGKKKK